MSVVSQSFARAIDPDIQVQDGSGSNSLTDNKNFLIIKHADLTLNELPTIIVDGITITPGLIGSGANYELRRVSANQTIIKKRVPGNVTIEIADVDAITSTPPTGGSIGSMAIGSTFVVA